MSERCPICGNEKPKEALFCDDCTRRIRFDYEIDVPEIKKPSNPLLVESEENHADSGNNKEGILNESRDMNEKPVLKKKKAGSPFLWIGLLVILLVGALFVYNEIVREENLEDSAWEAAIKENSVEGYLAYIELYPSGDHFDEAHAGVMKLKEEEASTWEKMKKSDNVAELRDFLNQYGGSPYLPLVRIRLDSLSWMTALKTNSVESYSEYMTLVQSGEFKGDYFAEAQKRYDMLYQSYPVDSVTLDSIRTTINGFYTSLSAMDRTGMSRYLAPHVHRFFDFGGATRERITDELLLTAAQSGDPGVKLSPNSEGVQYARRSNGQYKINVPLVKSYTEGDSIVQLPGYIVHIEMNPSCQISSIYETKPYPRMP